MASPFRVAMVQMMVTASKPDNVAKALDQVGKAAQQGAKLVSLPECFNCPYGTQHFAKYAEPIPGPTSQALAKVAKDSGVFLVGGSIPERCGDKIYNSSPIFSPEGEMLGLHRKVHLFDIDIPGKITFKESETLSPGESLTMFKTPFCKVGVGICYDMRFAELAQLMAKQDCQLLVYPGAFNLTTGPAHWQLLQQARALDNQLYVATASPARGDPPGYQAWGHSSVVGPWGDVLATTEEGEDIVYADIDLARLEEIRGQIPLRNQRRSDLYQVTTGTSTSEAENV